LETALRRTISFLRWSGCRAFFLNHFELIDEHPGQIRLISPSPVLDLEFDRGTARRFALASSRIDEPLGHLTGLNGFFGLQALQRVDS
jgi:hypothetical protein